MSIQDELAPENESSNLTTRDFSPSRSPSAESSEISSTHVPGEEYEARAYKSTVELCGDTMDTSIMLEVRHVLDTLIDRVPL